MPQIKITDTNGETHRAERTHPIPDDVDPVAFMDERTPETYTVGSVEGIDPDAELEQAIKDASNLTELKGALTGGGHPAQARRSNRYEGQ